VADLQGQFDNSLRVQHESETKLQNLQLQLEESRNLRSATEQKLAASGQQVADLQGQFDNSLRVQHESETKLQNLQLQLEESRNLRSATEQKLAASGQQVADLQGQFDAAKPIAVANGAKLEQATRQLAARQQELTDISCSLDLAQSARRDTESSLVIALQAVDEMTKTLAKAQAHLIDADAKVTATLAHAATQDEAFSRARERVETAEKNARNAESDLLRVRSERELLQGAFEALQERLEVAARRQDITNQELAANGQRMLAADANLLLLQNDLTHAESALQKTKASASTMHGDLVALAHSVGLSEPPPPDRLRELLSMLHRDANLLATTLVATGAGDAASLVTKLQVTQQQLDTASDRLRERETWIRILLLQSTKIRLRRRQLMPHEQDFLTRVKP
jgi:chromosome segregation ATPase